MAVIDELKFQVKIYTQKMTKMNETAGKVEANRNDKKSLALLKAMADKIETIFEAYHEAIQKINAYNAKQYPRPDEDGVWEDAAAKFDADYFNVKAILAVADPTDSANTSLNVSTNAGNNNPFNIQLPKLQLIEFDGNAKDWPCFSDFFKAAVHNNQSLTDVQRHVYLRSALKGEALSRVSSLPLTGANYMVCWDNLKTVYDNTHTQTNAYLEVLFNSSKIVREATKVREFSVEIAEICGALGALGHKVEDWAVPLLFMLTKRLCTSLREDWEKLVIANPAPTIKEFLDFLHESSQVLEAVQLGSTTSSPTSGDKSKSNGGRIRRGSKGSANFMINASEQKCACCRSGIHSVDRCHAFQKKSVSDRINVVVRNKLCWKCLKSDHLSPQCPQKTGCSVCSRPHHALLHNGRKRDYNPSEAAATQTQGAVASAAIVEKAEGNAATDNKTFVGAVQNRNIPDNGVVLLATARAHILDGNGNYQPVKLLIDSCSEGTFITASCASRLKLKVTKTDVSVYGLARTALGEAKGKAWCIFKPTDALQVKTEALVIDRVTKSPSMSCYPGDWEHIENLNLADPEYCTPSEVDILLGAEWYGHVMVGPSITGPIGSPVAVRSIWGYCLIGRVGRTPKQVHSFYLSVSEDLNYSLKKFWELEEVSAKPLLSKDDQACDVHFETTVKRLSNGKFCVQLPFREPPSVLGDSRLAAGKRLQHLERRLSKNNKMRELYNEFMRDYLEQGHMRKVTAPNRSDVVYYIPHHCIFRSLVADTHKFRVVFDASMTTVGGPSLNQILYKGPKLQADIVDILIGLRVHEVVLVCDVRQMYRNIMVAEEHQNYQRILWRFNVEDPVAEYCLTTVTYGVSASPYLAIKSLRHLANEEQTNHPAASEALLKSTYMDDIVVSVKTVDEAVSLLKELISLTGKGGFELRKWMSNHSEALLTIPLEHRAPSSDCLSFSEDETQATKILGLIWNPAVDCFTFKAMCGTTAVSKRIILSEVAKLYDPLGLICPVVFVGKCLIRKLWQAGLDWDEAPPKEVCDQWETFHRELPLLEGFRLPRSLRLDGATQVQLHGFSDSSQQGYAGVVYVRTSHPQGSEVNLVMAKSKVAPVQIATLPRLELCGLELLSRLLQRVRVLLEPHCTISSVTAWTDSMVVVHWVHSCPTRWHTFVANRVSAIQDRIAPGDVRYVPSEWNPADCASRGLSPSELINHPLWFSGPEWLAAEPENWPVCPNPGDKEGSDVSQEAKSVTLQVTTLPREPSLSSELFNKFSMFSRLWRVVAWICRYRFNLRNPKNRRQESFLMTADLNESLQSCVRWVQQDEFQEEIREIIGSRRITRLKKLNPFVDECGLLRVGGRLGNSSLPYNQKHPLLLPKKHPLTDMIIEYYHRKFLHPGPLNLHCILQRQFWIINGRDVIRHKLSKCVICYRSKPVNAQPPMADLPASRLVSHVKPFLICGVDYGGPFSIKLGRLRNARTYKAYICLFVCFSTKALHLELASELSTDAFIAALKRFMARRGEIREIWSDRGTNFIGAKRKLHEWEELTMSKQYDTEVGALMASRSISWKTLPSASPHMGGLWEAGIKSVKTLLSRVIGQQQLTYEEFYTVLVQVEATLNSRPLCPMSPDPNDCQPLTPACFLMAEPPRILIEPVDNSELPRNLRDRWLLLNHITKCFWKHWSVNYVSTLQQRQRWNKDAPNLIEGQMVLIKDSNLSPGKWLLGRIQRVFPGKDSVVRVAEVKTATGVLVRPVVKLCPLPSDC